MTRKMRMKRGMRRGTGRRLRSTLQIRRRRLRRRRS
jgi:hypothetical protein